MARVLSGQGPEMAPDTPRRSEPAGVAGRALRSRFLDSVFRQPEYALAEDVSQDFRCAGADAARHRERRVELPLPLVGRPIGAGRELGIRAQDLRRDLRQFLVELAPEELR